MVVKYRIVMKLPLGSTTPPPPHGEPKRKCPSKQMRDLKRSYAFILMKKNLESNFIKEEKERNLIEINVLKVENARLRQEMSKHSEELLEALKAQKEDLSKKHTAILKNYSENLKLKYEENFNKSKHYFESQIESLTMELQAAKRAILSVGTRRPVYSPGKYTENG